METQPQSRWTTSGEAGLAQAQTMAGFGGLRGGGNAPHWATGLLLGGVLVIGLLLRAGQMRESLWLDELHTAWTVSGRLADVAPRAKMGNNSPVYFYLPWLAARWLGMNEPALRFPSLVAGITLIAMVCGTALQWTGHRGMALMAAALAALDRNFLFYSLDARPYALVQVLGLLHVVVFWRLMSRPTVLLRLVWITTVVLAFYLHYTTMLVIAGEICFWLTARFVLGDRPAYRLSCLLLDLSLIGVLCLPALGHLMLVASRRENWQLFVARRPFWALLSVFPLATCILLPLVLVGLVAFGRWRAGRSRYLAAVDVRLPVLVGCWLLVPLAIAWLTTQTDVARLFFRRYLMAASAAPLLLSALIGSLCPSRAGRVFTATVVVATGLLTIGPVGQLIRDGRAVNHGDEDWRAAIQALNRDGAHRQLPVLVRSGLIEADALRTTSAASLPRLREYCLFPVRGIYRLDETGRAVIPLPTTDSGLLTKDQWRRIAACRGAWLLIRGSQASVDQMLRQLQVSAQTHQASVSIASRQPLIRRSDPFGLRRLSRLSRSRAGPAASMRRVTVVRVNWEQ